MSDTTNLEMLLEQILDRIAKLEEKLDYISSPNLSVLEGGVKFGDSDIESIALTSTGKIDISQVNEMRTENCNFDIAEIRNATNLSTE